MDTLIPTNEIHKINNSIDPYFYLFEHKNKIYRATRQEYVKKVNKLLTSGLINELNKNEYIPETTESKKTLPDHGYILEQKKIQHLTYPYEWSFTMLRDAAIQLLKINEIAWKYGYQLKDAHHYNQTFRNGKILFFDIGSFEDRQNESGWKAFIEFKESFYYPLLVWSSGSSLFARSALLSGKRLIPTFDYLLYKYWLLRHIKNTAINLLLKNVHYLSIIYSIPRQKMQSFHNKLIAKITLYIIDNRLFPRMNSMGHIHKIKQKIATIKPPAVYSEWEDYDIEKEDSEDSKRLNQISAIINTLSAKSLTDLGGNDGFFCKVILKNTPIDSTVCIDSDEKSIDRLYLYLKKSKNPRITPVLSNFMYPDGGHNELPPSKRFKSEIVTVLAVTHHLLLTQGYFIDDIFETIATYSSKHVFIEFMPHGLYSSKNNFNPSVPSWYSKDWFRNHFQEKFDLMGEVQLTPYRILFYGTLK